MKTIILAACIVISASCVHAQQSFKVDSADEVESLIESGKLSAGDTIVWSSGTYKDVELDIEGVNGTKDRPITLRAARPGKVIIRGESQFKVGAQHWVIQGFHFTGRNGETNAFNTFQFRSNSGKPAQHVRMTDCAFTNLRTNEETSKWVLVYGRFNSIDHCHFSGKNKKGALVTVELGRLEDDETAEHQFTRNYFADVAPQKGSDNETIRVGTSHDQNKPARCIVRENYFVGCDGEPEIISNKSSYNLYERNTFRQCNGALVLRHGQHARVEGNFFFGDGAKNSGGVRVIDSNHTVVNNYFQDLTGKTWNASLSILGGDAPPGGTSNGYQRVENVTIAHNSFFNCTRSILLNNVKGSGTPTGVIANNLVASRSEPLVLAELPAEKLKWAGNLMFGPSRSRDFNAITSDPRLKKVKGLFRPSPKGPAANSAVEIGTNIEKDIDGQTRPKSKADIGADEVSGATGDRTSVPLKPSDVGVSFLRGNGPNRN